VCTVIILYQAVRSIVGDNTRQDGRRNAYARNTFCKKTM
jgi:hypothetical protein